MTEHQSISLSRLVQSRSNVRRTGQTAGLEALMASIAAHGLRQNLNVRATTGGRFEVIAGGRRLIALKKLARAGTIPADLPVPCRVLADDENATEISLAENQLREAMHPDDQCTAFADLVAQGLPVEDIAARFGVTAAVVRQRLKLAAVSPKLRALYRAGETTLAHLMAVTLADDHAQQEAAFAASSYPEGIRRALVQDGLRVSHRLITFIGLDAYRLAGGGVLEDLFNPEEGVVTDAALVEQLAQAKLDSLAADVRAEGWGWVSTELSFDYGADYRRLPGTQGEDGAVTYSADHRQHAGARVYLDFHGDVVVERGCVRRQDLRAAGLASTAADNGDDTPAVRPDYPASVILELNAHRTAALRLELARNPAVALAAVVHALVTVQRNNGHPYNPASTLTLGFQHTDPARRMQDPTSSLALDGHAADLEYWSERIPAAPAEAWDWCLRQDTETLLAVLAVYSALSVDAVTARDDSGTVPSSVHGGQLATALDLDMTAHWQPTPAFMERLRKPVMAAAVAESGNPALAADVLLLKKPAAAAKAAEALHRAGWLPPVLRRAAPAGLANDNVAVAPWVEESTQDAA